MLRGAARYRQRGFEQRIGQLRLLTIHHSSMGLTAEVYFSVRRPEAEDQGSTRLVSSGLRPWLADGHLLMMSRRSFLCVYTSLVFSLCVKLPSFRKDISHIGL